MFVHARRTFFALVFTCGLLVTLFAFAQVPSATEDRALAMALRSGGFVIVVRHGATFPDQADTDPFHLDNVAAQRNLNDNGKALAKAFGESLRQVGIPIGRRLYQQVQRCL
jgi:hypothetical protein